MEGSALQRQRAPVLPRSRRLLGALGDDRLVEQVRRGNAAAFEVIYDRHYRGILSFCRHMLGSRDEAEDALQQTFTSAFTDLQSNARDIRLKAWLYTIARNRCLSILRARREQPAELDEQSTAGLSEEVQRRADLRELLGDLRDLPADQREALVLFELGDLSHAEVANVIGVEPVKVKALVFQARSSLIENREARAIPCAEIREELSTATGGALRRGPLRRHLKHCEGCSQYRDRVHAQRRALALVLPVIPTAGLKDSVLAALGFGGGAGGAGVAAGGAAIGGTGATAGGGGFFASAGGIGLAKVAVATTLGVGAVAGGGVAIESAVDDGPPDAQAAQADNARDGAGAAQGGGPRSPAAAAAGDPGGRSRASERRQSRERNKARVRRRNARRKKDKDLKVIKDPAGPAQGRGAPGGNGNGYGNRGGGTAPNGNGWGRGGSSDGGQSSRGNGGRSGSAPPPNSNAGGNGNGNANGLVPEIAPEVDAPIDGGAGTRDVRPPKDDGGRVPPPVAPLTE